MLAIHWIDLSITDMVKLSAKTHFPNVSILIITITLVSIYRTNSDIQISPHKELDCSEQLTTHTYTCWPTQNECLIIFVLVFSPYFCTGRSPSCLTEMVEQMPEGMKSDDVFTATISDQ